MAGDCHMHMVLDGVDWRQSIARHQPSPNIPWIRQVLKAYQTHGYTYLRDGGDRWGVGATARELAGEYGIEYRTPLAPLHRVGHYGGFIGQSFESTRDFEQLLQTPGRDFVKIMISGLMDFDRPGVLTEDPLPPALIQELIHIAHDQGYAVMVHANGARTVEVAAEAGVDSVEHGAYLDSDALATMADQGTVWVPTLSTIANLRGKNRFQEESVVGILEGAMENVANFVAMGGLVAPGTDAGAWAVPHGCGTEEALLAQCGADARAQTAATGVIQARFRR